MPFNLSEMATESNNSEFASLDGFNFQDVLEKGLRIVNVNIKKTSVAPLIEGGDNYCSQVLRVNITFSRNNSDEIEQTSVIVKNILNIDFFNNLNIFHKERLFYSEVLPKIEFILDDVQFAPKCFMTRKRPVNTLAFQDMTEIGYKMCNREIGLDEEHTRLALNKLGQFHAVTMVFTKKDPEITSHFSGSFLDRRVTTPDSALYRIFENYFIHLLKVVSQWNGFEEIYKKLQLYNADRFNRIIASQNDCFQSDIKVLNHGDFWINNMLFKYDAGHPTDLVFVDFQHNSFASPGLDLNYFLYTSLRLEDMKNAEKMLNSYYDSFKKTLQKLNYENIPSYDAIVQEFRRTAHYGFVSLYAMLPLMTLDKENSKDNNINNADDEKKISMSFSSKRVVDSLQYGLRLFDKLGVFDG